MAPEDSELIRRHLAGDGAAFSTLVERYQVRLWNYLLRWIGDRGEAEDLIQEVFLRFLRRQRSLLDHPSIEGWLFRVARNLVVDLRKRESLKRRFLASRAESQCVVSETGPFGRSEPEARTEKRWFRQQVEKLVRELPESEREVFLLRHHSALPFKEIAKILDVPLNTALGRMHRAMRRLRESLGSTYGIIERE